MSGPIASTPPQDVRFCRSADGTRLAYAVHGSGPPLLLAACWLSHLEFDWQSPVWRHFLLDLGRFATDIRYDERGFGMSDWDVADYGLQARIADLEAVADAAGLDRFALLGTIPLWQWIGDGATTSAIEEPAGCLRRDADAAQPDRSGPARSNETRTSTRRSRSMAAR